ncbi:MAG TPA: hypothetical protein VMG41_04600 [Gemmatimonadales bacterium]|nr:hypothetical protein [Gemmatimonadales bacterium]
MRRMIVSGVVSLFALVTPGRLKAQQGSDESPQMGMMEMVMGGGSLTMSPHMTMTPTWREATGDRARADSIVRVARAALARYRDVRVAEQDGYRRFAPSIKQQRVYHYTSMANALKARWTFDATAPTSLLYRPMPDGSVRLIGAMYTAPARMSPEELNQRLPLSIAQWHQHTNLCFPRGTGKLTAAGGSALADPDRRFGFRGTITTKAACDAAGGEFHARVFGWMAHVNMFADDGELWEHHTGM